MIREVMYDLTDRFFVDDGELDGLPPALVFALGVEWSLFRALLLEPAGLELETHVHEQNVERIQRLCWNHRRKVERVPDPNGVDGWVRLRVAARRAG